MELLGGIYINFVKAILYWNHTLYITLFLARLRLFLQVFGYDMLEYNFFVKKTPSVLGCKVFWYKKKYLFAHLCLLSLYTFFFLTFMNTVTQCVAVFCLVVALLQWHSKKNEAKF